MLHLHAFPKQTYLHRSYSLAFFLAAFVLFFINSQPSKAQNYPAGFSQVRVAGGIKSPTAMAFAPDGRIFVAEQSGALRIVKNGTLLSNPAIKLSVSGSGERGLIGVTLDPNFSSNGYIYLYYTVASRPYHNRISRFTVNGDAANPDSEKILLDLDPLGGSASHNGGAMQFGRDGKLYVAIGENYRSSNAQSLNTYLGKLLRINPDGSVPAGNPFPSGSEARKRIWAYGLRNPFTFDIQPGTGRIFVNDVGAGRWEEINDATQGGQNFGWPNEEGNRPNSNYDKPVYTYPHGWGNGLGGCAITGGAFLTSSTNYPSAYVGKYFYQDYCSRWINVLNVNGQAEPVNFARNIPDESLALTMGNDGSLYFLSRQTDALYKIVYGSDESPRITEQPDNITVQQGQNATFSVSAVGDQPLRYQWQKNGNTINGANSASYTVNRAQVSDEGQYRVIVSNGAGSATSQAASLNVNASNGTPTAQITSPGNHSLYRGGDRIYFSGVGTDPEDGTLPASAYQWKVVFHHDTHIHPGPSVDLADNGRSGSFEIPDEGESSANVWYQLVLTVRDSRGNTSTDNIDIDPRVVTISLVSNPAGLQLSWDDEPDAAPFTVKAVAGMKINVGAPSPQGMNGKSYTLANWNQEEAEEGTITIPNGNATYTANFRSSGGGGNNNLRNPDYVANPTNGLNYSYYEGNWRQLPNFDLIRPNKRGTLSDIDLAPANARELFAMEYTGYVKVSSDGDYDFSVKSDDGSQLLIGSEVVVDNDGIHSMRERSGSIGLKAGLHAITVRYYQRFGGSGIRVFYAGPGLSKREIPETAWYRSGSGNARIQAEEATTAISAVEVYPNPATDHLTLRVVANREGQLAIGFLDNLSRKVSGLNHTLQLGVNEIPVNVGNLPAGVYAVSLQHGTERVVKRVVITR